MLTVKSFVVLAAAAFAVAQVEAAAESSVLKISIHHNHKQAAPCKAGFREVSVEGVAGVFCAKDQICVADKADGNCPEEAAPGMPYGAYCDVVKTGVYGCKPVTEDMLEDSEESEDSEECGEGESPMSVEGVEGVFCVKGQACVADIKDGACPGPQDGLPNGASCGIVKTGVYGCKPNKASLRAKSHNKTHHKQKAPCQPGFREVSVEGVAGIYCAKDQICVANINGNCPGPSPGLQYGAYCGTVKSGVLGCKPKTQWMARKSVQKNHKQKAPCQPGFREVSVEGVAGIYCAKDQICVANINGNCPGPAPGLQYGAYCGTVKTGVLGCKPKTQWMARKSSVKKVNHKQAAPCKAGFREVSVEGVAGVFCAKDQICVADKADGNCPEEAAPGMPYGAYCDVVKTGVYGCKPVTEDMLEDSEDSEDSEECGEGETEMSVEGVEGIFCIKGPSCVADKKDGVCPGPQEGLPYGASCGIVKTGVYGCKPNSAKAHKKSAHKKH